MAGNARRPISVTTAPMMPVAVAKIAQVISVATASDPGMRAEARCRPLNTVDQVGALDQVAHEDEERNRDRHVDRHHPIGALDKQVECAAATAVDGSTLRRRSQ